MKKSVGVLMTWYLKWRRLWLVSRCSARNGFNYWCVSGNSSTHSLMMWGWRKSLRFWISRLIFPTTSRLRIFCRFRIFTATLWPVSWCSPTNQAKKSCTTITFHNIIIITSMVQDKPPWHRLCKKWYLFHVYEVRSKLKRWAQIHLIWRPVVQAIWTRQ